MPRVAQEGHLSVPAVRAGAAAIALAGLLLLASCATVPQRSPSEWLGVLPADATLYASLSVPGSAAMIKKSLTDAGPGFTDVSALVDRSTRLVCSVTLLPGEPARFSAVALGNYPAGIIGLRLAGNKEWRKVSSPAGSWWEWSKAGLQMGIPNNGILLASNGDVQGLLGRWSSPPALPVPPDVAVDMRTADLVVYMPELPGGIGERAAANNVRIPIQEVWVKAVKTPAGYDVSGSANTGSEREAKLVTLALRLGIVAWMRTGNVTDITERLTAITVSSEGPQVRLAGLRFTESEIVPVFLSLLKGIAPSGPAAEPAAASTGPAAASTGPAAGSASEAGSGPGPAEGSAP